MTERSDISTGRLVYTCNCGWLDTGHLNPHPPKLKRSGSQYISATNLWAQLRTDGNLSPDQCGIFMRAMGQPNCGNQSEISFPGGTTGYKVVYRQDMGAKGIYVGSQKDFLVKKNLTLSQRKSVALAIFLSVSHGFESLQSTPPFSWVTTSGYSQEDLVSNLLGFYIAIGELTKDEILRKCKVVSANTATQIWDRNGSVGENKNRTTSPELIKNTGAMTDKACINECIGEPREFPFAELWQRILPAQYGVLYKRYPRPSAPPFSHSNLGSF